MYNSVPKSILKHYDPHMHNRSERLPEMFKKKKKKIGRRSWFELQIISYDMR